ncbi:COQ3.2 family protein [Megaselia abdita]
MPTLTQSVETQKFLDTVQYSHKGIHKYELIFGEGFISTGGVTTTVHLCEKYLDGKLPENPKILDVGCGIGGGSVFLADRYNATVVSIDLGTNVINIAKERYASKKNVSFAVEDAFFAEYKSGEFDMIYSRDAFIHVAEKEKLFNLFYKWLKPGGFVFISDYCCGEEAVLTDAFKAYVAQRNYSLTTWQNYERFLTNAGFTAKGENVTEWFRHILAMEKERLLEPKMKAKFLETYSTEEMNGLIAGWDEKLVTTTQGNHIWAVFFAVKE